MTRRSPAASIPLALGAALFGPACPAGPLPDEPEPAPGAVRDGRWTVWSAPACEAGGALEVQSSPPDFIEGGERYVSGFGQGTDALLNSFGGGVAVADLDGDGLADRVHADRGGASFVAWGTGDVQPLEPVAGERIWSASVADADGDGRLDVLLGGPERLALLMQVEAGRFEDQADAWGLEVTAGVATATAWADVDGDDDLDLFVAAVPLSPFQDSAAMPERGRDTLWLQEGGRFVAADPLVPLDVFDGWGLVARFDDVDLDGDPDLLVLNDIEPFSSSRWFENLGGSPPTWVDRLPDTGLPPPGAPMGLVHADLDGDGVRDLWISQSGLPLTARGLGGWSFVETTAVWGTAVGDVQTESAWGALPWDPDGDGDPGLLIAYGGLERPDSDDPGSPGSVEPMQRLRYVAPEGDGFREDPSVFPEPLVLSGRGVARADLDGDALPDLVLGCLLGPPRIFLRPCRSSPHVSVSLRQPGSNPFAVGAQLTLVTEDRELHDQIAAGGPGPFSGEGPAVHFEPGPGELVELRVRWPDGEREQLELPCSRCRVELRRD